MPSLRDWMRREDVSDAEMASRIGGVSAGWVRKLRFKDRTPSLRVAARIEAVTSGEVRSVDLLSSPQGAPAAVEARP